MPTTQYIGSRYVPLFADPAEWSSTKTYEALTIVLHQGNSYTSKQFVPIGIDIDNTDFWVETGNYNAQVENYRREVLQYANDVADLKNTTVKIKSPTFEGSAVLLQYDDINILFDCGTSTGGAYLYTWLLSEGVSRLDAIVLTHMHYDHVDGFENIITLCDNQTDIFVQMAPTPANSEYSIYQTKLTTINNLCASNGLKQPITPINGSIITYGVGSFTFFNTDTSYRTTYDTSIGNGDYTNPPTGGLNNYSIITICDIGDFTYVDTGDVEGEAQRLNAGDMRKANVARNPHHFANLMGYFDWYVALSPNYWIVTLSDYASPSVYVSYLYRFALEGYANKIIYPYNQAIEIEWHDTFINAKGDYVVYANQAGTSSLQFYASLPAKYYNANPFILHSMTIEQYFAATKIGLPKTVNMYDGSAFVKSSTLYNQLINLFTATSGTIILEIGKQILHASYGVSDRRNADIYFYTSYRDSDYDTRLNYDVVSSRIGVNECVFATPIGQNASLYEQDISSAVIDKILKANIITARLNNGALVPCVRVGSAGEYGRGSYRGTMLNSTATDLYSVQFNNEGILTQCCQINIANGNINQFQINRLSVMV